MYIKHTHKHSKTNTTHTEWKIRLHHKLYIKQMDVAKSEVV